MWSLSTRCSLDEFVADCLNFAVEWLWTRIVKKLVYCFNCKLAGSPESQSLLNSLGSAVGKMRRFLQQVGCPCSISFAFSIASWILVSA